MSFGDDERMNLPDVSVIHRLAADPADDLVRIAKGDTTDLSRLERFDDGPPGRFQIRPARASIAERRLEKRCRLIDPIGAVSCQVDDAEP